MDSIHDQIHQKYLCSDTGFSLHYSFLYSLVLGLEAKHVFEFGSGFSTHCILHALEITGGELSSCDVRTTDENKAITDYTKKSSIWNFIHGNSNLALQNHKHAYYDLILHDGSHTCNQVVRDLDNIFSAILFFSFSNYPKWFGQVVCNTPQVRACYVCQSRDYTRDSSVPSIGWRFVFSS